MRNKRVVITGASRGIGREIAMKFAIEGAQIAFCSSSSEKVDALAKELPNQSELIARVCDMKLKSEINLFLQEIKQKWKHVDVLVNNMGIFIPGAILDEDEGALEEMFQANVMSAYRTTRGLIEMIRKGTEAHIINMCSTASMEGYPNGGSYGISKHALLGFSRSLRAELLPEKIRVSAVMPGATYTDSWSSAGIPKERFMEASDVASLVYAINTTSANANVEEILLRPVMGNI